MTHQRKNLGRAQVKFDMDGSFGQFKARFATLGVVDKDSDVILSGAVGDGRTPVRISYWGHRWSDLPVGKGEIYEEDGALVCEGKFFLDIDDAHDHYKTVKALGELVEWSFGFDIEEASPGEAGGRMVRYLKRLRVFEVSPVMQGAGIDTSTVDIKHAEAEAAEAADVEAPADTDQADADVAEVESVETVEAPEAESSNDEKAKDDACKTCGDIGCSCEAHMGAFNALLGFTVAQARRLGVIN
jgi:hypothetical protein